MPASPMPNPAPKANPMGYQAAKASAASLSARPTNKAQTVQPGRARRSVGLVLRGMWKGHKIAAVTIAALVVGSLVVAASLLIRQDFSVSNASKATDVVFAQGTDYSVINAAGFATVTIGSSGTSATVSISGVPGAALVDLTKVLKISNTASTTDYVVTFARTAAPNAAITGYTVNVLNGASSLLSWNAASSSSSSSFTLAHGVNADLGFSLTITDGTAVGSLGSFTIQASIVPA